MEIADSPKERKKNTSRANPPICRHPRRRGRQFATKVKAAETEEKQPEERGYQHNLNGFTPQRGRDL